VWVAARLALMRRVPGAGIDLAVWEEGDGPAVLLLHGFPDTHRLWRNEVRALTSAGLRTIAPDLRGRGESSRPRAVGDYEIRHSVADMVCLLDELGVERAHVVGHDFGAVVAWVLAALHRDRVDQLVVMSVGHPATAHRRTIEQREKAWYTLLFQFEDVAERLLMRNDWQLFREWLRNDGDVEEYIADLSRDGALTAGLRWYRANLAPHRQLETPPSLPSITVPTLGMWSSGDHYLTEDRMMASTEYVSGPWRYERLDDLSHWMQLDAPHRVDELLLDFLRAPT
jgi:pimeloyl-ACP methyl ester carboxylesterase